MIRKIKRYLKARYNVVTQHDLSMSALDVAIDAAAGNYIAGDYFEFGVYKGESFTRAYHRFAIKNENSNRRFFAVDSFEGLPESEEIHKPTHYSKGMYSASTETFKNYIQRKKVNLSDVICIEGFYDHTLSQQTKKKHNITKVAVAYIDVDLYESTVPVLNFLTDIIDTGTIIVVDDWFRHLGVPTAGIQKAFREWLEKNPSIELIELHKWRRIAFIVNKKNI